MCPEFSDFLILSRLIILRKIVLTLMLVYTCFMNAGKLLMAKRDKVIIIIILNLFCLGGSSFAAGTSADFLSPKVRIETNTLRNLFAQGQPEGEEVIIAGTAENFLTQDLKDLEKAYQAVGVSAYALTPRSFLSKIERFFRQKQAPAKQDVFTLIEKNISEAVVIPEQREIVLSNLRGPKFKKRFGKYIRDIFKNKNIAVYCSRRIDWNNKAEVQRLEVFFGWVNECMKELPDAIRNKTRKTLFFDIHSAEDFYDIFEFPADGFAWDMKTNYGFGVNVSNFDVNMAGGGERSNSFDISLIKEAIVHEFTHKMILITDADGSLLLSRDAWNKIAEVIGFDLRDKSGGQRVSDQELAGKLRENEDAYYTPLKEYIAYAVGGLTDEPAPVLFYNISSFSGGLREIESRLAKIKEILQEDFLVDADNRVVWDFQRGAWNPSLAGLPIPAADEPLTIEMKIRVFSESI